MLRVLGYNTACIHFNSIRANHWGSHVFISSHIAPVLILEHRCGWTGQHQKFTLGGLFPVYFGSQKTIVTWLQTSRPRSDGPGFSSLWRSGDVFTLICDAFCYSMPSAFLFSFLQSLAVLFVVTFAGYPERYRTTFSTAVSPELQLPIYTVWDADSLRNRFKW